jgi:hypothetical protein
MPNPPPLDYGSICGQLQGFSGKITGMLGNVDGESRNVVSSLLNIWKQHFAEMQTAYPAAMSDIQTSISRAENLNQESNSKIAATKAAIEKAQAAQAAAAAAKKAAPKVPPLKPIDPALGVSLRDELLERFGVTADAPGEHLPEDIHEIWEGWKFESWDKN